MGIFGCFSLIATLITLDLISGNSLERQEYCNRPWPKLSLFVPIGLFPNSTRNSEWSEVLLPSLELFWPFQRSNTSLVLIVDNELKGSNLTNVFINSVIEQHLSAVNFPKISVQYHIPEMNYANGQMRQQHIMFHADQYVSNETEYVGFIDSDAVITGPVDREDLFENGKPVVHGRIGYLKKGHWKGKWARDTYRLMGYEETMTCMSYFPMMIKKSHLAGLREYLRQRFHSDSFDRLFKENMMTSALCQFNLFCSYMWQFHRDEYTWRIHDTHPNWDGANPAPVYGQWSMRWIFDEVRGLTPKPMIATHARYRFWSSRIATEILGPENRFHLHQMYIHGLCHAVPEHHALMHTLHLQGANCTDLIRRNRYFAEAYKFEDANFAFVASEEVIANMTLLHDQRIERFHHCNMSYMEEAWHRHIGPFNYEASDLKRMLE